LDPERKLDRLQEIAKMSRSFLKNSESKQLKAVYLSAEDSKGKRTFRLRTER